MSDRLRQITDERISEVELHLGVLEAGLETLKSGEVDLPPETLLFVQLMLTTTGKILGDVSITLNALAGRVDELEHVVLDDLDPRVGELEEKTGLV